MNALNQALADLMDRKKLSDADLSREINKLYTAAAIGNYRRGARKVPLALVDKLEELYKEDIRETAKTQNETNVSRETAQRQTETQKLVDRAHENQAITWELWVQLKQNNEKFEKEIDKLWGQIEKKDQQIEKKDNLIEGLATLANSAKGVRTKKG